MSAVSKKLLPAASAASTTFFVAAASRRQPKLLQPRPATETSSDPIRLVSTVLPPLHLEERLHLGARDREVAGRGLSLLDQRLQAHHVLIELPLRVAAEQGGGGVAHGSGGRVVRQLDVHLGTARVVWAEVDDTGVLDGCAGQRFPGEEP